MKMLLFIAAIFLVSTIGNYFRLGYDDTDDKRPGKMFGSRSGLILYTDCRTGVQYVKGGLFGNTTPRLDRDGKLIIAK